MAVAELAIVPTSRRLSYDEALRVARLALRDRAARTIVVDLQNVTDATTSAFARLVLLRRSLRTRGRDLRLANLHDRAAHLYEISRLDQVLPREQSNHLSATA